MAFFTRLNDANEDNNEATNHVSSQTAALENKLIVSRILSFLSPEDLQNCRLVNTLWNREAVPFVKCSQLIQFCNYKPKLVGLVQASEDFPFKKFVLRGTSSGKRKQQLQRDLIVAISGFVKEFTIDNSDHKLGFQSEALLPMSIMYPHLTTFKVLGIVPHIENPNVRDFAAAVIKHSPNLKKLAIADYYNLRAVNFYIKELDCTNGRRITSLSISGVLTNAHFAQLTRMGLQLEFLKLDFVNGSWRSWINLIGEMDFTTFLELQASTLKTLCFRSTQTETEFNYPAVINLSLPRMYHVEKLSFGPNSNNGIQFLDLCFPTNFPTLKTLIISEGVNLNQIFKFGMLPLYTVQHLEFPGELNDSEIILNAATQFPQVRQILVPARVNIVEAVYKVFQNIEELTLQVSEEADFIEESLTGYSREELKAILELPEKLQQLIENNTEPVQFLQRLISLKVQGSNAFATVRFTDFVCCSVVTKMRSLKRLDLLDNYCTQISKSVLRKMEKTIAVYCRSESVIQDRDISYASTICGYVFIALNLVPGVLIIMLLLWLYGFCCGNNASSFQS